MQKLCNNCHINVANNGYNWCQKCFINNSKKIICSNCNINVANNGYKWFQKCFLNATKINSNNNEINFYDKKDAFYEFTNFFETNIFVNGILYPSSEHFFQSQKFHNITYQNQVRPQEKHSKRHASWINSKELIGKSQKMIL